MTIEALNKPRGVWCRLCKPGAGCQIYSDKPLECGTFLCGYLIDVRIGEIWKPDKSKLVIVSEFEANRIGVHVDPGNPSAWRAEPFYQQIKGWAVAAAPYQGQVFVYVGRRVFIILPREDIDLGTVGDDEVIITGEELTAFGTELTAFKMHKDDPRGLTMERQKPIAIQNPRAKP